MYRWNIVCGLLLLLWSLCKAQDRVVQPAGDVTATEGDTLTLGCTFQTSDPSPTLFWYKQKVNDFPKMLLLRFSTREDRPAEKQERIDAIVNKTSVPLQIQKLQLSDSAVYYCALRPTVTGNNTTLGGTKQHKCRCDVNVELMKRKDQ
uniref:Ig-like domain-containing protein n=1 Tax=Scophthalmus maximus TaxID=52904 RepID=A0A8D3E227_SCOMX